MTERGCKEIRGDDGLVQVPQEDIFESKWRCHVWGLVGRQCGIDVEVLGVCWQGKGCWGNVGIDVEIDTDWDEGEG